MSKAVISGYYGYKNFGDEAILSVLVEHLKSLGIDITILSGDVDYTKTRNNVNAINRFDINSVFNEIKSADYLISGGGSLLQDVTSLKSLIYYLSIIAMAIVLNKKVFIFAQGIGPINNFPAGLMTKFLLRQCYYVSVRDENSFNLLKNWNVPSEMVCDPVYSIKIENVEKADNIGIQLRNFKTMNYTLLQKLAVLINEKFADKKIQIFSLQSAEDLSVCKRFEALLKKFNPNLQTEIIEDNIVENLSKLEYFIGMRFHSLMVALKSGVKSCAINYDIKVEKLAQEFDIPTISMNASENFENIYNQMINQDSQKFIRIANSKSFDWSHIDSLL